LICLGGLKLIFYGIDRSGDVGALYVLFAFLLLALGSCLFLFGTNAAPAMFRIP